MKIEQFSLQRTFTIKHNNKIYIIDYLDSTEQILELINRDNWEIYDENRELLNIYPFRNSTKKEKLKVKKNLILAEKLIKFCIKHFDDYNP